MLLGIDVISPLVSPWGQQLALVKRGQFNVGKAQISAQFATAPENVEQLIEVLIPGPNGRKTIILRTDDAKFSAADIRQQYVTGGFDDLVGRRPDVDRYIEVGNEPNLAGVDATHQVAMLRDAISLKGQVGHGRLSWLASLPTKAAELATILPATADYDALACHWYSWTNPATDAGGGDWKTILDELLTLDRGVWITECGIDDQATPPQVKAARILNWMATLPARVVGVCMFAVGAETQWPHYALTEAAADVYAGRLTAQLEDIEGGATVTTAVPYPTGGKQQAFHVDGYGSNLVTGPFLDFFNTYGGLKVFGFPLCDVQIEDGRPVQYFERNVFEYHPESPDPGWRVQLRRLGADAFDALKGAA